MTEFLVLFLRGLMAWLWIAVVVGILVGAICLLQYSMVLAGSIIFIVATVLLGAMVTDTEDL